MSTMSKQEAGVGPADNAALLWTARLLGLTCAVVFWLVVATFPAFFFFNPWGSGDAMRSITLTLSSIGWILISLGPLVLLWLYAAGRRDAIRWLPVVALWWPISLLISHITVFLETGHGYVDYLATYPIFLFTDIALPVLLMAVWRLLPPAADPVTSPVTPSD